MKKIIIGLTLLSSLSTFASTQFSCEATAGVNGDFSRFSKTLCNKKKTVDECSDDYRCTPVKVKKTRICETISQAEDAITGREVIYNTDGTVSVY